jgi:hypothetical protein
MPAQGATWLVFVDDMHLDFRETGRLRTIVRIVGEHLVRPGDRCAMAGTGPSGAADGGRSNCDSLAALARQITGNGLKLSDILRAGAAGEVKWRAESALQRAETFVMAADAIGGPATLLFISNGYSSDSATSNLIDRVAAAAAARGIMIVPIDIRGGPQAAQSDVSPEQWRAHVAETRRQLQRLAGGTGGHVIVAADAFEASLARLRPPAP